MGLVMSEEVDVGIVTELNGGADGWSDRER